MQLAALRGCSLSEVGMGFLVAQASTRPKTGGAVRFASTQKTRHGYDVRTLCAQLDARPPEIRQLMRGTLNSQRTNELVEEMRAAGLPL